MLNLSTANLAAIASEMPWPVDFVEMVLDKNNASKTIRLTNHYHNVEISGNTYLAAGSFLGFTDITEGLEAKDNSVDIQLSGVDVSITASVLAESIEGSNVSILRGYYDDSTGQLVDPPFLRWSGRANNYSIQDDYNFTDQDAISITVSCKSLLSTLMSKKSGRFTSPQSFAKKNPGDKSMEFVPSLATFSPNFGKED